MSDDILWQLMDDLAAAAFRANKRVERAVELISLASEAADEASQAAGLALERAEQMSQVINRMSVEKES